MSEHALNHRFRRLRAQAVIIREGRKEGFDMKDIIPDGDLPVTQEAVEKNSMPLNLELLLLALTAIPPSFICA